MAKTVISRGRSGRQVISLARIAKEIISLGRALGHIIHSGSVHAAVSGTAAATLVIFMAGHAASSPPLGEDVTGTAAASFSMGSAASGVVVAPVTGVGAPVLSLSGQANGSTFQAVTGTADATLVLTAEGVGGAAGAGDATLVLTGAGVGSYLLPVVGAGARALALTASGVGAFYPQVVGAGAKSLLLTASASGSAGAAGVPVAPLSITAPVVGVPLTSQWALQGEGAVGPLFSFTNGVWNTTYAETPGIYPARPNDPYLQSLGFYYNNYGDLWIPFEWNDPGGSVAVERYNFAGAPDISFWGDGASVVIANCENFNANVGRDINRNSAGAAHRVSFQITRCDMNATRWDLLCSTAFELGPNNFIRKQVQELGFGGGYQVEFFIGINCHHNYMTGGGVNAPSGAHIEWWQHLLLATGTGSYCYIEDNMIDFTKDGQTTTTSDAGWTGVVSEGGDSVIRFNRNIVKGIDIAAITAAIPYRMGPIVAYGDENVLAGFEMKDNAMACSSHAPGGYTYKHGGGSLKPTISGNRTFRDADSDAAGVVGPADNTALTLADFG